MDHPRFGHVDDYFYEQVKDPAPDFENKARKVRIHDWRSHVGEKVASIWATLPYDTRLAIALDAQWEADKEEWE